jgi:hypothetical protein
MGISGVSNRWLSTTMRGLGWKMMSNLREQTNTQRQTQTPAAGCSGVSDQQHTGAGAEDDAKRARTNARKQTPPPGVAQASATYDSIQIGTRTIAVLAHCCVCRQTNAQRGNSCYHRCVARLPCDCCWHCHANQVPLFLVATALPVARACEHIDWDGMLQQQAPAKPRGTTAAAAACRA